RFLHFFFFSSRRRHTRFSRDWSSDVCSSDLESGIAIPADMINYGVTKAANLAVSHGLAKRLAGTGVTVNAVLPGPTLTDGVATQIGRASCRESGAFSLVAVGARTKGW